MSSEDGSGYECLLSSIAVMQCGSEDNGSALQGLVNQSLAEVLSRRKKKRHIEQRNRICGKSFDMLGLGRETPDLKTLFNKYQGRVKRLIIDDQTRIGLATLALMRWPYKVEFR